MRRHLYKILLLPIMLIAVSCNHDDDFFEGPSLEDQFGDFSIVAPLALSAKSVDFSASEELVFFATLSINSEWQINITGLSSGASKVITGKTKVLDAESAAWTGGANSFPSFALEDCAIELFFPTQNADTLRDTVTITGLKADAVGTLVTGFENGIGGDWEEWSQTTVTQQIICGDNTAAKGDCYYSVGGVVGWDWGIGNVVINSAAGDFGLGANANAVYFNAGVRGVKSIGSSIMQFSLQEDDNGDGTFDAATEDSWVFEYNIVSDDWELVSFSYGDLNTDAEGNPVETNGNGLLEPNKLITVTAFVLANPDEGEVVMHLDQIIFTNGGPYEP